MRGWVRTEIQGIQILASGAWAHPVRAREDFSNFHVVMEHLMLWVAALVPLLSEVK